MSSLAGGSRRGVHDRTGAGPRTTSGAMGPTAKASRPPPARPAGCSESERAIEPAGVARAGLAEAAFQHVLAVEVGALAVGRRGRMHDGGRAGLVEAMQVRHRRIEREEGIERQRRRLAVERERLVAAQARPNPDRRPAPPRPVRRARRAARSPAGADRGPPRARLSADRPRRTACPRRAAGAGGSERGDRKSSAHLCRVVAVRRSQCLTARHRRWNSGAMNNSASACGRLSARMIVWRVSVEASGASASSNTSLGSACPPDAPRQLVGNVEALREAVEPRRALVGRNPWGPTAATAARPADCAPASSARCRAA